MIKNFPARSLLIKIRRLMCRTNYGARRGWQIVHGIYRDFPHNLYDPSGGKYQVASRFCQSSRDGRPIYYSTEQLSNGIRIYLGDKNVAIPSGDYL